VLAHTATAPYHFGLSSVGILATLGMVQMQLSLPKTRSARIPTGEELSQGNAVRLDTTRAGWLSNTSGRRREYGASFGGVGERRVGA
jgi:hypothetical protein